MKELFRGSCVALITPFKNNKIDYEKLENILDIQIVSGTSAILVLGTTGESPTIKSDEREEIISFCREKIPSNIKMIVGTGCNSTDTAVNLSKQAEELGADGIIVVTPYYNKCTQEGLIKHYTEIAKSVHIPLILYNVPSRTCVNIEPETAKILAKVDNIVGIKEANSNREHIDKMFEKVGEKMAIYSGNDDLNYYFLERGGQGVISVTANIFPELVAEECNLYFNGDKENARYIQGRLCGVNRALFVETNPIPVKYGASYLNMCENELRLPLTPLTEKNEEIVKHEIDRASDRGTGY